MLLSLLMCVNESIKKERICGKDRTFACCICHRVCLQRSWRTIIPTLIAPSSTGSSVEGVSSRWFHIFIVVERMPIPVAFAPPLYGCRTRVDELIHTITRPATSVLQAMRLGVIRTCERMAGKSAVLSFLGDFYQKSTVDF